MKLFDSVVFDCLQDEKSRYLHIIRTWRAKHDLARAMSNKYLEEKEELEKDLLDMTNEKKR